MFTPVTAWGFFAAFGVALTLMTLLLVVTFAGLEMSAGRLGMLTMVWAAVFVVFIWILMRVLIIWAGGLRAALRAEGTQGRLLAIGLISLPVLVTSFFWMLLISLGQVKG